MPRRVDLPGADELFRRTAQPRPGAEAGPSPVAPVGTGRVRHEEKITVYVSRDELLALETARLRIRAEFGLAADRGRIVRAAIASALAQLDAEGSESELARRLAG